MKCFALMILAITLTSCGSSTNDLAERKPVPPPGTDEAGSIPWNDPGQGVRPGGFLGSMMEGR